MLNNFDGYGSLTMQRNVIEYVNRSMITKMYQPEDYIIAQNQESNEMYFLAIGHCEVWIYDENKKMHKIKVLIPGSMFGEIGLICDCNRTASVKCKNYTTCAYIDREQFMFLCENFPDHAFKIKRGIRRYQDRNKQFQKRLL